jgi:hypothetical protein
MSALSEYCIVVDCQGLMETQLFEGTRQECEHFIANPETRGMARIWRDENETQHDEVIRKLPISDAFLKRIVSEMSKKENADKQ